MKKLIFISALAFGCCSAFIPVTSYAQASKMDNKMMKDGTVKMVSGKMMVMKGGNWVPMDHTMTMPNGTKVMTDGSVMTKAGKKDMLKEGDCVKPDGMVSRKM
jgi:hypothetical protein